ncbi:hypothetical protein IAT38_007390 [Cryptococcus sp. DSM 104549]
MSEPTTTPPPSASAPTAGAPTSTPTPTPTSASAPAPGATAAGPRPPLPGAPAELPPLTGFRSALEHTGLPRSVLLYKPRLPSRNWCIFWTILGSVSFAYSYDRRESKRIKEECVKEVEGFGREVLEGGSLGEVRKVEVWGARWGGDEDSDRALRYFRKYVKPYLVAAGIDYTLPTSPLHGSITRQIHARILASRRQSLGLAPTPPQLSLPGVLSPEEVRQKELEGGTVLVGRASLKEYLEGVRRGWEGGVGEWEWEKDVEGVLERDGVFDVKEVTPVPEAEVAVAAGPTPAQAPAPTPAQNTPLGFLSRPSPSLPTPGAPGAPTPTATIPAHLHTPPNPLPAQPPILLLPFTNHLGFTQLPHMIYDFFTERYRVQQGADAARALIYAQTRDLTREDTLEFGKEGEAYYGKAARELPKRIADARKEYYDNLAPRIEAARAYEAGQREMTEEEVKKGKVETVAELKEERKKKELRWMGSEEGWRIVEPQKEVVWRDGWEGWLKVFKAPEGLEKKIVVE